MKEDITRRFRLLFSVVIVLLLSTLSGCVKRTLDYPPVDPDRGTLEVVVKWGDGAVPVGARLLIYNDDDTFYCSEEYKKSDGIFSCTLPAGSYRIIVHNTDAEGVNYRVMSGHSSAEVYALGLSGGAPSQGDVILEPHYVYGASRHDGGEIVTIEAGKIHHLMSHPVRLTRQVDLRFRLLGLDGNATLNGILRGVSPSVSFCTGLCSSVSCLQPFTGESLPRLPGSSLRTNTDREQWFQVSMEMFNLLTHIDSPPGTNTMEMNITDGAGQSHIATADITGTLQGVIGDNGGTLPLEIPLEVIVVMDPVTLELAVSVSPWDNSGTGGGDLWPQK